MAPEDLIEEALSDSFAPPPLKRQSLILQNVTIPKPADETNEKPKEPQSNRNSVDPVDVEAWKSQYEEHVKEWRSANAEAREKAEQERARWESIREKEKVKGPTQAYGEASWQSVSAQSNLGNSASVPRASSPSPADVRDLVSGESQNKAPSSNANERHDTWEDLPSELASSLPSMSFPSDEHSTPPEKHIHASESAPRQPLIATTAVFDSSLSTGTRAKALVASLAINLLLPFVNGVMLGFGEIFAKNVVLRWFGWNTPAPSGTVASSLGIGATRRQR